MDHKPAPLLSLPYDIFHLILTQLENFRSEACKPRRGRPQIPTNPTHYTYFPPFIEELPPKKPHDSPRRAEKWRIEQSNLHKSYDYTHVHPQKPKEALKVAPAPFEGASMFDALSRTNKALRELCAPYIFRNVVMASDDCLTIDRIGFYASEKQEWMLKHIRSFRLISTNVTWPNSLGGNTPEELLPDLAATLIRLLRSIPNLQTLHFIIEPSELVSEFKSILTTTTPPISFPTVKHIYINTDNEYMLPFLSSPEVGGLESFEYKAAYSLKSANKVTFSTIGATAEEKETGLFGGMTDARAVEVVKGLAEVQKNSLKKMTLAAFINDTGIVQMVKAGILENIRELVLLYTVAATCATSLSHLPHLRYIRFGQDDDPISAKNPHCYMSRRELLTVVRSAKKLEEVWYRDRFVCHIKRLVGEGHDGTEVNEDETWWMDTWAPDGLGSKNVISSGWLG
ncbi:uncharacterized protein DFL_008986 [Arthrobotrys flagrans]|uniref:Uncharacterized protein n=1 Tax=Arthrobotrys flagrans TaxID=97331 RepID=A0A436ZQD8_ARTFL|nr:hypothetical protein DFL_008986 [Arthrobotrys flagrans]